MTHQTHGRVWGPKALCCDLKLRATVGVQCRPEGQEEKRRLRWMQQPWGCGEEEECNRLIPLSRGTLPLHHLLGCLCSFLLARCL